MLTAGNRTHCALFSLLPLIHVPIFVQSFTKFDMITDCWDEKVCRGNTTLNPRGRVPGDYVFWGAQWRPVPFHLERAM